jgi:hypothetical protein
MLDGIYSSDSLEEDMSSVYEDCGTDTYHDWITPAETNLRIDDEKPDRSNTEALCAGEHVWDRQAQIAYADVLLQSEMHFTKGLHPFAPHAPELKNLNNRHENTMTLAERLTILMSDMHSDLDVRRVSPWE